MLKIAKIALMVTPLITQKIVMIIRIATTLSVVMDPFGYLIAAARIFVCTVCNALRLGFAKIALEELRQGKLPYKRGAVHTPEDAPIIEVNPIVFGE